VVYTLTALLTFCNMAVFFAYFQHLTQGGLSPENAGLVVGVFSAGVLVLRPLLAPLLIPANARGATALGAAGVAAALLLYPHVQGLFWLLVLRVGHGLAYCLLGTAAMAGFTGAVPPERSGQAFGLMGVVMLLPFAVLPPLLQTLEAWAGGLEALLAWTGAAMLAVFPLLALLPPARLDRAARRAARPSPAEVLADLGDPRVLGVLAVFLALMTAFSALFYLLEPFALGRGLAVAGWFFGVSTATEIGVRLAAGGLWDRLPKGRVLAGACLWLAACFAALTQTARPWELVGLGAAFGLGWGVAIPLFYARLFELSAPRLRSLNTNLANEAFQGGFLLGPLLGGLAVGAWGAGALFWLCAALCLASAGAVAAAAAGGPPRTQEGSDAP
jgi:predicted MFS family arabinose efflux permease